MTPLISEEQINDVAQRLIREYNPISIYIFGSYAWGTPNEDSDLDLMIIVEHSDDLKPHLRTVPGYMALRGVGIPKELIVLTKDEFEERCSDENRLAYQVYKRGKCIYSRP